MKESEWRPQVAHIVSLMRSGIDVAIVTAAGYPGEPERFEQRVAGLLAAFRRLKLPAEITDRCARPFLCCPRLHACLGPVQLILWLGPCC